MAKTTKFTGDTQIEITPKSKNITYQYTGEGAYIFDINTSVPSGYDSLYKNFAYRTDDDLVLTTIFASDTGKVKTVTTTILGYFTNKNASYTVNYKSTIGDNVEPVAYSLTPKSTPMRDGYYGTGDKEFYKPHYLLAKDEGEEMVFAPINEVPYSNFVYAKMGDDEYANQQFAADYVYDMAGNDKYYTAFAESETFTGGELYAYDYSGDDYYGPTWKTKMHTKDYAGDDEYEAQNGTTLTAVDYKGGDKYSILSASKATITDHAGKDEYEINGGETNATVTDLAGKDTYNIHTLATATITDSAGADEYKVSSGATATITDEGKETDTYDISGIALNPTTVTITDSKGKEDYQINGYTTATITDEGKEADKYYIANHSNALITDNKGKDTYTVSQSSGAVITDYGKENDKYYAEYSSGITSEDFGGNDKYDLRSYTTTTLNDITDRKGNDGYEIYGSSAKITDEAGKDKYTITDLNTGNQLHITDTGKGNDSYKIAECYNMTYGATPSFQITDSKGNETYTIASLGYNTAPTSLDDTAIIDESGNDKYNFTTTKIDSTSYNEMYIENVTIHDKSGNDKYSLAIKDETNDDIDNLYISDDSGKDTYSFSGLGNNYISNLNITDRGTGKDKYTIDRASFSFFDEGGNDTYKLTNISGGNISDGEGNDKYTLKSENYGYISVSDGGAGKDSYTIDISTALNAQIGIEDRGGKDSLVLSGAKASNLVFMADITKDNKFDTMALIVYDKTSESFTYLHDFYTGTATELSDFGIGRIETVKAGKTTLKEVQSEALYADFNELKSMVAGFVGTTGKSDVFSVLTEGTDEQRETLAYIFENHEMPSA